MLPPRLFSSCGKRGLLSSCIVQVSHCSGFSCCRAWALGYLGFSIAAPRLWSTGSLVVAHRLHCSKACGILLTHDPWIKHMSSALAGGFFTTESPGKPQGAFLTTGPQGKSHCLLFLIIMSTESCFYSLILTISVCCSKTLNGSP